jgi:hypothetical protein
MENTSNGQIGFQTEENSLYKKVSQASITIKKTEKIVTAIYMVTDYLLPQEPLRGSIREESLNLLSSVQRVLGAPLEVEQGRIDGVYSSIELIGMLLSLGTTIGMISEMNGAVLQSELEKLHASIRETCGTRLSLPQAVPGYQKVTLESSFFTVAETPMSLKTQDVLDKGHVLYQGQSRQVIEQKNSIPQKPVPLMSLNKKTDLGLKIARRNDVLSVVRSKGKVSIKDITQLLKDTSEKTVQRLLLELVKEGTLIKEGEKRWSTYRLA